MKKIIMLTLSALILSFATISAQQDGERGERRGRGERGPSPEYLAMIDTLALDADQKVQFDAMEKMYREKRQKEMRAARESGGGREAMRATMQKISEEQSGALKNLLTEEQYNIYSAFMKKEEEARAARRGRGRERG